MHMRDQLLSLLPPYLGTETVIVAGDQEIEDIMREVISAHKVYVGDYDFIAHLYVDVPADSLPRQLFDFCKKNIAYLIESDRLQTTRSPASILAIGSGDCKHYASFIGGVLDAVNRRVGYRLYDWFFRFASYSNDEVPEHVFVVIKQHSREIWVDPVLKSFNSRNPYPRFWIDGFVNKKGMSLKRIAGVDQPAAFCSDSSITREEYNKQKDHEAGSCMGSPFLTQDAFKDSPDQVYFESPISNDYGGGGGGQSTLPTVFYPTTIEAVQYGLLSDDGTVTPLAFPAKGARAPLPGNLVIFYPEYLNGRKLPVDLPKPIAAGKRLVLLPKLTVGVRDQYKSNNYEFLEFMTDAMLPLVESYGQYPDWSRWDIRMTIWDDMDRDQVVDYITSKPVAMAFEWEILDSVVYFMNGEPMVWPPDRNPNSQQFNRDNPPPKIADDLAVVYPDYWRGVKVPDDLPRPVMNNGKLQLQPHGFSIDRMRENYYMWDSFLVSVLTPLIRAFAQFPYTGNNDLPERVWNDIAANKHLDDYLAAPDRKTFLGEVIETVAGYVQEVTRLSLKVINFGSRLAFLGLVRINAFAFAYKLFLALNDPDRRDKLYDRWRMLGGNKGDFNSAIILGCKNNPIFGGGVKQWIEDAVQDGIIDNGYIRPEDDEAIPEGETMSGIYEGFSWPYTVLEYQKDKAAGARMSGAAMGVAGADDVVYYMAAASAMIAALGAFLKGIGGPKTDKIVDDVTNGYDVLLTAVGEDPIGTGNDLDAPVKIYDPVTGITSTIYPQGKENAVIAFIKANPVVAALGAAAIATAIYFATKRNTRRKTA